MDFTGKIINEKYLIKEKIGEGGMSTIWLAEDLKSNQVAVKILKKDATSNRIEDIIRFRNEATTVSKLNIPGIVKIFEIGEIENIYYIVMEYVNGKSLFRLLKEEYKFTIDDTVEIIYKVSNALQFIHNSNIIHRDLKPENIIIAKTPAPNPEKSVIENWDIRVIDFGLAQVREFNFRDTLTVLGTLCYMAPELSGIIKRSVDERSDLYAVGVIFYQILTEHLPYQPEHKDTLHNGHFSRIPEKPTLFNPKIPEVLEKIILKLLERNPDKRYQSASGLISDLDKYKKGLTDFVPGIDDKFVKLNYQTHLIGRDEELDKIKSLLENASKGTGSICFIGGEAGNGKTRLTQELRNYVYEKQGAFIDGKCFSGQTKTPYGPFKDALNVYIRDFNKKYLDAKKKNVKEEIKDYIGDLGEILIKLNPVLEEITGKCPPLVMLEPEIENQRFLIVISDFFYHLSLIEDVLVVVLDDLHWSDEGSFDLLNQLVKEVSKYPLLIIGTYRDNELFEGHSLQRFMNNALVNNYPFHHIQLKPFDSKNINKFIASLLYDNEENITDISSFVFQKSKGNPFFTIEIIKQLVAEKAIVLQNARWVINQKVIDKIKIPSTIVDILIKKISLLDEKEINILSYAAIVGKKFDMELLFLLGDLNKVETVEVVDHAIELQLLEEDLHERGKILFVHDRIKEAFDKNINNEIRRSLHLKIAETLENVHKNDLDKVLFDLTYHYIEGENQKKALEYSFPSGIKAKINFAYEEALEYFTVVKYMLEENGEKGNARWLECMEHIGDIYVNSGKIKDTIDLYKELMPYFNTKLKKAQTYRCISYAYYKKSDWKKCEEYGRLGLEILGEKTPNGKIGTLWVIMKETVIHFLHSLFPEKNIPLKKDYEETAQIIWLYYVLALIYPLTGSLKFISTVLRMINIAEYKIGKSQESALSIMNYALYLAEIPKFKPALKYHQKALQLRKELHDDRGLAQSFLNMGYYYKCKGEYDKSINCFKENMAILSRIGDIAEINATIAALCGVYIYLADYENAKIANYQYYDAVVLNSSFGLMLVWMYDTLCYTEKGDFENAELFGMTAYKLAYKEKDLYMSCITGVALGRLFIEKGNYDKAIEYLNISRELFEKNRFFKEYAVPLFPCLAEAYIGEYLTKKVDLTKAEAKNLLKKIKKSCTDALQKTKLWKTHHVCSLRVYAKYLALTGNNIKAKKLFIETIETCKSLGRKYELALTFYEYSNFLEKTDKINEAQKYQNLAYDTFSEIGATSYKKRIDDQLGIIDQAASASEDFSQELKITQRLSFVLPFNQELSSILDLEQLLKKILSIATEVTSAHRGCLLLKDDELKIKTTEKNININDPVFTNFSMNLINQVMEKGETLLFPGGPKKQSHYNYQSVIYQELKSVICIPIKGEYKIKGVCYLDNPFSKPAFTEEDVEILNLIMKQAAISIRNALIYKQAAKYHSGL